MPASFTIKGIEPNGLNTFPDAVRLLYWSWVTTLALKAKDRDLAAGLDAYGEPLRPISKETRKHRVSAMTPSGKGDPSAPPLSPGHKLSRVRSLLAGRALVDRCELWWRYDPFTHASFSKILTYQQEQGRDVFGLSDESVEEVRLAALRKWRTWLITGQVVPLDLVGKRVQVPMAPTGTTGPIRRRDRTSPRRRKWGTSRRLLPCSASAANRAGGHQSGASARPSSRRSTARRCRRACRRGRGRGTTGSCGTSGANHRPSRLPGHLFPGRYQSQHRNRRSFPPSP